MLIMPETNKDFNALGEKIANSFFTDNTPLAEGVIKTASHLDLNVEETKRLLEKANTFASIKMVKASSDGRAEFDLASAEEVLPVTHGNLLTKQAAEEVVEHVTPTEMPKTYGATFINQGEEADFFKVASEESPSRKQFPLRYVNTLKREVDELCMAKVASELVFTEGMKYLTHELDNAYAPDFSKFAGDIFSVHGEVSVPMLDTLAKNIRKTIALEKTAGVVDDNADPLLQKFAEAQEAILGVKYYTEKIASKKNELQKAWRSVKNVDKNWCVVE